MCEGIGFSVDDLMPILDSEKIRLHMCETDKTYTEEENHEWFKSYSKMSQSEKLSEIISRYEEDESFGHIFFGADTLNVLCASDNGDGKQFILYPPSYPWNEEMQVLKSIDSVKEYLCEVVMNFTLDSVTEDDLIKLIDTDIYEVGCG